MYSVLIVRKELLFHEHAERIKDFALRGNVVDMAVGVVIGAAFGKIVSPGERHYYAAADTFWEALIFPPSRLCPECLFLPWLKPRKWESLSLPTASS